MERPHEKGANACHPGAAELPGSPWEQASVTASRREWAAFVVSAAWDELASPVPAGRDGLVSVVAGGQK